MPLDLPPGPGPPCGLSVQVEDAMLDTYDLVYEQAMKGTSHVLRQELAAIQDVVSVGMAGWQGGQLLLGLQFREQAQGGQ